MDENSVKSLIDKLADQEISAAARRLYPQGPVLQHYRPRICPFGEIIQDIPNGSSVLDIGCGSGLLLGLLAYFGRLGSGIGIDNSRSAIAHAQNMAKRSGNAAQLTFEHLDVDANWPTGSFDVVTMVDVMHHVPRVSQPNAIDRVTRSLRPGGLFVYKDMGRKPAWMALANRIHDLVLARQWIHYVPIEVVAEWGQNAGLELVRNWEESRLWYRHEAIVFRRPDANGSDESGSTTAKARI